MKRSTRLLSHLVLLLVTWSGSGFYNYRNGVASAFRSLGARDGRISGHIAKRKVAEGRDVYLQGRVHVIDDWNAIGAKPDSSLTRRFRSRATATRFLLSSSVLLGGGANAIANQSYVHENLNDTVTDMDTLPVTSVEGIRAPLWVDQLPLLTFMMHCAMSNNYTRINLERAISGLTSIENVTDPNVIVSICIAMRFATVDSIDLASALLDIATQRLEMINRSQQSFLSLHQIAECFANIKVLDFKVDRTRALVGLLVDQMRLITPALVPRIEDIEPCFPAIRWLGNHSMSRHLLGALNDRLKAINQPISAQSLSNIAFGVRYFRDCPELRNFLAILRSKLEVCDTTFDSSSTERMVFSLTSVFTRSASRIAAVKEFSRNLLNSEESIGLRSLGKSFALLPRVSQRWSFPRNYLFNALSQKLRRVDIVSGVSADVRHCLSGLAALGPNYRQGRMAAFYLSQILNNCSEEFAEDDLANSINSLKFATSKPSEFRSLISALSSKVSSHPRPLSGSAFSYALNGLKRMDSISPQVRQMQTALIHRFPDQLTDVDAIARSFAGMQSMNSKHRETRQLLSRLTEALKHTDPSDWNAQRLSYAMLGFRNLKSHHLEVRGALREISGLIEKIPAENFTASHIRNCFYSLKCMSPHSTEVKHLLQLLSERLDVMNKLEMSEGWCGVQNMTQEMVYQCINGLQSMRGDTVEMERILKTFCDILDRSNAHNTSSLLHFRRGGRDLAVGLRGLHSIGNSSPEALRLIDIIAARMGSCRGSFNALCLKASMPGLNSMNDRSVEVSHLLGNMSAALNTSLSPDDVAFVMSKLRFLTGKSPGSKRFLSSLTAAINRHSESPMGVARHIIPALHGIRGLIATEPEVQDLLASIVLIAKKDTASRLTPSDISKGLLGLQFMPASISPHVQELISYFDGQMRNCTQEFTPLEISGCLQGLSSMSPFAVKHLMSTIASRINTSTGIFTPDIAELCLYSLRNKYALNAELNDVLAALANKIHTSNVSYTGRAVGTCMLGLQSLSTASPQALQLVSALSDKVAAINGSMSQSDIGSAFYGLQMLSDRHASVRRMVHILTDKIQNCSIVDPRMLSCVLHGLQSMPGESREVRTLLGLLSAKASESLHHLGPQYASAALFGLRKMAIDTPQAQSMVMVLSDLIANSSEAFSAITLGGAFAALQNMKSHHASTKRLVAVLTDKLQSCPEVLDAASLSNIYQSLHSMKIEDAEVARLMRVLCDRLAQACISTNHSSWDMRYSTRMLLGLSRMTAGTSTMAQTLRLITQQIRTSNEPLSPSDFANALIGLSSMSSKYSEVAELLGTLASKFQASNKTLGLLEISKITYGLTSMSSEQKEVRHMLGLLRNQLMLVSNSTSGSLGLTRKDLITSDVLLSMLQGLRGMSSLHKEVRQLVATIADAVIRNPSLKLTPRDFALALNGLRGMRATDPEVNRLLEVIFSRTDDTGAIWNAEVLSSALYGLRLMTGKSPIVRTIVRHLVARLKEYQGSFSARQIGDAMYGMQLMTADIPEVRELLTAVQARVLALTDAPTGSTLGYMLYGLRSMSAEVPEVRSILRTLTGLWLKSPSSSYSSLALCNTISGLQHMDSSRPEVKKLLAAVYDRITNVTEPFSMQSIGRMMHGLQFMNSSHVEVLRILSAITEKLQRSPDSLDEASMYDIFFGLRNLDSKFPEVQEFLRALTAKIERSSYKVGAVPFSNALLHMRYLDTGNEAVRGFLKGLLSSAMLSRPDSWTPENVFKCLSYMRSITDKSAEAEEVIGLLASKLEALNLTRAPVNLIGKAAFGLQHMRGHSTAVRRLLSELNRLLLTSNETATPGILSSILVGFKSMTTESPELRNFLQNVADRFQKCNFSFSPSAITHSIAGLQSMNPSQPEVRSLLRIIGDQMVACREALSAEQIADILMSMSTIGRSEEPEVRHLLLKLRSKMNVAVDSSIIGDVLACLRSRSSDELKLIEILVTLDSRSRVPEGADASIAETVIGGSI